MFLDEVDLRSENMELILGVMRRYLDEFPQLRLVLASQNPDLEFFTDYFDGPYSRRT